MKLSSNTLTVLKNFSTINSNLVFSPGGELKSMSNAKNILSSAEIEEDFEYEFGIYDLNEFLAVVGMFESPDLSFHDNGKYVTISENGQSIRYFFSEPANLTSPKKNIVMASTDVSFDLSNENLNTIRKAAGVLGTTDLMIEGNPSDTHLDLTITDISNPTSNSYSIKIDVDKEIEADFQLVFNINNFKFDVGDYIVDISSKLISKFTHKTRPLMYWVALEKTSKFN
jgi:hypothetical protein